MGDGSVAPSGGSPFTLTHSKPLTHSVRGPRSRVLGLREGNGKAGPMNPESSSSEASRTPRTVQTKQVSSFLWTSNF